MLTIRCNPAQSFADFDQIMEGFLSPSFVPPVPHPGAMPRFPAINLWQNDTSVFIEAELPGFRPEDIDITVQRDEITLKGSRTLPEPPEGARPIRQERASGTFERVIRLPFAVANEKAVADFKNGVLTLTLPKPAEAQPRKVRVLAN
ncbi:MAG: Hsp20/alpha crystallin family protein [Phycisphaerae bacterium]|nr:Hsp20/alpha crystallin family protein [Phycisphaerae bacterium]